MRRVAVVGTAGRKEDAKRLTKEVFDAMTACVPRILASLRLKPGDVTLVSGGAAGADHVAVRLWLESRGTPGAFAGLCLHLPASMPASTGRAIESGPTAAAGRTMNLLHGAFSRTIGRDSLAELAQARAAGATVDDTHAGFSARNRVVAASDVLIAFTWGASTRAPKAGGTKQTWDLCTGRRIHVPLKSLMAGHYRAPPTDAAAALPSVVTPLNRKRGAAAASESDERASPKRARQDRVTPVRALAAAAAAPGP